MPRYLVKVDNQDFDISVEYRSEQYVTIVNGEEYPVEFNRLAENRAVLLVDGESLDVDIESNGYDSNQTVFMLGQEIPLEIENYNLAQLKKTAGMTSSTAMAKQLKAPMPGMILDIKVKAGDTIKKGDPLLIIEAMKMENVIKATGEGVIKEVAISSGQSVEKNDRLVEFE